MGTMVKEYVLQEALARVLTMHEVRYEFFWHHSPNEGDKGQHRWGKKMKRQGTKAGFPDMVIFPKRPHYPYFIELKAGKNKLSANQKIVKKQVESLGYTWYTLTANNPQDAINQLLEILKKENES